MILFCDTSALVKLYVQEVDSDSIQLAAAQTLNQELPGEVGFACFDTRLVNAARLLGMTTA
jgi:predicted nucleic acid-binding protein